jgi:hypothetical protein
MCCHPYGLGIRVTVTPWTSVRGHPNPPLRGWSAAAYFFWAEGGKRPFSRRYMAAAL